MTPVRHRANTCSVPSIEMCSTFSVPARSVALSFKAARLCFKCNVQSDFKSSLRNISQIKRRFCTFVQIPPLDEGLDLQGNILL